MKNFIERWKNHGYEKGESQKFWIDLLETLGVKNVLQKIFFEQQINGKFIDAIIPAQKVLIEQKSLGKNLADAYEQAKFYDNELPFNKKSRWIICSDFQSFEIHDMNAPKSPPEIILLENLEKEIYRLNFLIDDQNEKIARELKISLKAGEIVGKIYDALKKNYLNPNSEESLQSLNKLCVRLVFCLYAESSGIFGKHKIFRDYLQNSRNIRQDLILLFDVLNTEKNLRDPYLADELKIFPFVNGGLFAEKNIEIPNFNDEVKKILFDEAENFDWSGISPTIFGAVFESTLNPVTRREGGMHYTSIENIHKVINPLFLDDLHDEFAKIKNSTRNKNKNLLDFQNKLAELKFFDPACGSGNFLTESFISLRRLENEILKELLHEKILLGELDNPIKISINQFFGIEINDFAVAVAQTALWIAELQMLQETQNIIHKNLNPLPLKNFANIFEGNALRLDWQKICPNPNFIFGNPPFIGKTFQTPAQKADMKFIFDGVKNFGNLDYVAAWYKKTFDFISDERLLGVQKVFSSTFRCTKTQCAFVSTNSLTQGEQVLILREITPFIINFAHRTFKWQSESKDKADVHCVIIGFANFHREKKFIFDGDQKIPANFINFYLDDAQEYSLKKRNKTLQKNFPQMRKGNMPLDGGNLILSEDEKNILIEKFPDAEKFLKILIGGEELLHNKKRFCLWLVNATPSEIKKIPPIYERIKKCREFRFNSKKTGDAYKFRETPQLFREQNNPENFIAIPQLSSENRKYIPIDFFDENFIPTNLLLIIPDADLFLFGILTSSVHMAFVKKFCGRLESRLRYSAQIIYNNFPFCEASERNREKICETAKNILEVRAKYFGTSLADLYDENLMPKELRDAHKKNDLAVMSAYGFE